MIGRTTCTKEMHNGDSVLFLLHSSPAVSCCIVKLTDLYIGWSKEMTLQQTYLLIVQYIVLFDLCVHVKMIKRRTHGSIFLVSFFEAVWFPVCSGGRGCEKKRAGNGWKLPFTYHTARTGNHTTAHKWKDKNGTTPSNKETEL